MRLYAGSSTEFVSDAIHNLVAERLRDAFFCHFRYNPSPNEVASWRNSLRAMSQVIDRASLRDHGVILEYQLPLTSRRLDCMVTGHDEVGTPRAVIVELKQWERCGTSPGDNEVTSWIGGAERDVLHPSVQVGQYLRYLNDTHTAFHSGDATIRGSACAYLHNYTFEDRDALLDPKFTDTLAAHPIFSGRDVDPLSDFLQARLRRGRGIEVMRRVETGDYGPSKKLLEHVAGMIRGTAAYTLLDEQLVVYDKVRSLVRGPLDDGRKTVVVVRGGPGTGKSVIALNLMADLLLDGLDAQYATGSRAFTETLRNVIGPRGAVQFKYFNSYVSSEHNQIDVLIADEAHRIRSTSVNRFMKRAARPTTPQVEELIRAARLGVFFIDDRQVVRPDEIGSSDYVKRSAEALGCRVFEYELEAQFRCRGSEAFINWIENTLGITRTANVIWDRTEEFDFQIFDSPEALEAAIRARAAEGATARMTAGFHWPWSKPDAHGYLRDDVVIGDYARPWNARSDAGRLAPGIPKEKLWAHDPNGIGQVGCVYTAQGFEFDYVGVIFGPDLVWDPRAAEWRGDPSASADTMVKRSKAQFRDLVKNTYRVLLSRGLKGCYVYFMDENTRNMFRSRME